MSNGSTNPAPRAARKLRRIAVAALGLFAAGPVALAPADEAPAVAAPSSAVLKGRR
jgi:hypothetical protein